MSFYLVFLVVVVQGLRRTYLLENGDHFDLKVKDAEHVFWFIFLLLVYTP